ncbi:alpha/beta fold hydrolase [Pseudomonas citrulli]|uniref:Alpha/beta hydrolase n=1 Tax=Pseudomonas citrulli TaxID=3064347 RepID=A0ABT9BZ14_9PSED|nr:alpha/beta hydrolase [Pseudomonas sp. K18]MDO7896172.1 alpha/beta hydrolase [Pseudomonas sp. K18]
MVELIELEAEGQACLVLIHGTAGNPRSTWASFASHLDGHRVLAVDLSRLEQGRGAEQTLDGLGQLIAAGVRDRVSAGVHLVGYSLGAAVAIEVASVLGPQVLSLSLLAPFDNARDPQVRRNFGYWQRLLEDHPRKLAAELVTRGFSVPCLRAMSAAQVATRIEDFHQRVHWPAVAAQMVLNLALDVSPRLARLECPTAVIVGLDDRLIPPSVSVSVYRQLPRGQLFSLPCGHLLLAEDPHGVARIVQRFVTDGRGR